MPKQSKAQPNRAADGANTFEFYEHAELGLNAESVPDALAGYWTRVLTRVKERSEAVRAESRPFRAWAPESRCREWRLQQHERKFRNENENTSIQERDHEQAGREEAGNEGTHGCHRP